MMGSGGLVVMDEDTCIVDVARFLLSFTQSESCGKCAPCRVGTRHMVDLLDKITTGKGTEEDQAKPSLSSPRASLHPQPRFFLGEEFPSFQQIRGRSDMAIPELRF